MADWNAAQYLRFADERTRPAADLLARVPLERAARVVDLGCGPGNSTALLAARFPGADILGVDGAPDMLAAARRDVAGARFVEADLLDWAPQAAPDLIFANAVLHWLPDHASLLPRLAGWLAPGGCLAVQVPDNLEEPSHRLMRAVAADGPWAAALAGAGTARTPIAPAAMYYDWLVRAGCSVEVWTTTYLHPLADAGAIAAWFRASGLRPYLDALDPGMQAAYLAAYEAALTRAYPPQTDGRVLLAFPRLFLVARRDDRAGRHP